MSTVQNHLAGTSMLFRALDAAKNWRALGLLSIPTPLEHASFTRKRSLSSRGNCCTRSG